MQVARRSIQVLVVAFVVLVPMVNYYGVKVQQKDYRGIENSAMLSTVDTMFGEMDRDDAADLSHKVKGSVWTAEVFGVKVSDPLAALESTTTATRFHWPLILSIALPVLVTLILGRAYCGWMCPMNLVFEINDKLRGLLKKTGYNVRNVRFGRQTKYVVLGVGLLVAFIVGIPVLSLLYPPAILSREVFYKVYGGAFGSGLLILAAMCLFELILSQRWWCRYVCPGGAVYSGIALVRRLRIVRNDSACDRCGDCVPICPYDLRPMTTELTADCDQCGQCVSACDPGALNFKFQLSGPLRGTAR